MSGMPHSVWGLRNGAKLGQDMKLVDTLWAGLADSRIFLNFHQVLLIISNFFVTLA